MQAERPKLWRGPIKPRLTMRKKTKRTEEAQGRRQQRVVSGRGWAWQFDFGLGHWATPTKSKLTERGLPSPEAKPVMVRLIKEGDYRKLVAR